MINIEDFLKVGDKVKIIEDLTATNSGELYGYGVCEDMEQYRGQELTIKHVRLINGTNKVYVYDVEENEWGWTLKMFDAEYIKSNYEFTRDELLDIEDRARSLETCYHCGAEIDTREGEGETWFELNGRHYCEYCYEEHVSACSCCGEMFDHGTMYINPNDEWECSCCYNENWYECEDCGTITWRDDMYEVEDEDGYSRRVCDDCYSNYPRHRVYGYHEVNPAEEFYRASGENEDADTMYIGTELEVRNNYDDKSCIDYLYDNLNVVLEHDSSIGGGYEIVSAPQTFDYILETSGRLKDALQELKEKGYTSHDAETCGLHVHVTRPFDTRINELELKEYRGEITEDERNELKELREKQETIADRIMLVLEAYKEEFIKFSRRTSSQLHWTQFMSDYLETGEITSLYYIKKHKEGAKQGTRYMVLNLRNEHTFEFRLFRGTLNFDTYMASVELVKNIMALCSDLSIDIKDITWSRLTETPYTKAYCDLKNIKTDKVINDTSLIEIEKENRQKAIMNKFGKHLKTIWNYELKVMFNEIKLNKDAKATYRTYSNIGDTWYTKKSRINDLNERLQYIANNIESNDFDDFKYNIKKLANMLDLTDSKYTKIKEDIKYIVD